MCKCAERHEAPSRFMSANEAAAAFEMNVPAFYKSVNRGEISRLDTPGRQLRFLREYIEYAVEHGITAANEMFPNGYPESRTDLG